MSTRREFLRQASATALVAASVHIAQAAEKTVIRPGKVARASGVHVKSLVRREETVLRYGGVGDNWHMSWGADDRQYVSQCDGFGWAERPKGLYNSRMLALEGEPQAAQFLELPGYPELIPAFDMPRYYNFGTLAVDGHLYQFLSTWSAPANLDNPKPNALRFIGAKIIYSSDNGRTWCNQNGTTPVVWERWEQRSRDTMVFFEEDQEAFSMLTVLQMGKNYEQNRDGYIYVYAPNGNADGTMNELVMFRALKTHVLDRKSYEYFAGSRPNGSAIWSTDIHRRKPIHTFPRGWVNTMLHPFAWQPSVVYNAPLGLYMMANWGTGVAFNGEWFGKPSYLGFWVASNPWGPWAQVHEETAWMPASDPGARAFAPQIAPKWIAPDGKSFWLVWSDYQVKDEEGFNRFFTQDMKDRFYRMQLSDEEWVQLAARMRRFRPFYAFNLQRVDLEVR